MKKRSLLAFVLSFALILSVCTCAFGGVVASAATTAPSYDPWSSEKITTYGTQLFTESLTVLDIPEYDTSKAVYTKTTVTRNDNNILNTTPVILLAKTDSDLTHAERGNFKNSYLVMWMAASGGYAICLLGSDVTGTAVFPTSFLKFADQTSVTGFAGYGGVYPGGGASILNYQEVITKIEDGKISVWMKDSAGNVKEILREYSHAEYNITGPAAGYLTSQKISNNYNYACEVWVDGIVEVVDPNAQPKLDETTQKAFVSEISSGIKSNTAMELYDIDKYVADGATVYTKTVVKPSWGYNDYSGPIVALAATDYKADDTDTKDYYLGVYCLGGHGWGIAVANDRNQVGGTYVKYNMTYSDGTMQFPTDGLEIVSKVSDGKISVWIDGNLVLENYSSTKYNITAPVLGACGLNTNGYSLNGTKAWVDNADYGYLGDLNADLEINILDLVRAKKISANIDGASAFNDNVKAFNSEGTIGSAELIQMRQYLLGVIDKFEVAIEYGEDTTPAEGLL